MYMCVEIKGKIYTVFPVIIRIMLITNSLLTKGFNMSDEISHKESSGIYTIYQGKSEAAGLVLKDTHP